MLVELLGHTIDQGRGNTVLISAPRGGGKSAVRLSFGVFSFSGSRGAAEGSGLAACGDTDVVFLHG